MLRKPGPASSAQRGGGDRFQDYHNSGYDAKIGKLLAATDPRYGFAHNTNHTVLLFFSWATGDVIPSGVDQKSLSFQTLTSMLPGGN